MSRIDALPADQRSVLQLLLRQGKGYDDLSGLLNLHAGEVRSRAYDALDALGPGAAGLPSDRRQAIADWLLGQQGPDKAKETRKFISGSPAGRAWAQAVANELRPLGGDRLPDLPLDGATAKQADAAPSPPDGAAADGASADAAPPAAERPDATPFAPAPSAAPRVSRRGGAILIAAVLAAIVAAVLVIVLTGNDDNKPKRAASTTTTAAQPTVKAQANMTAPEGAPAAKALAIVQVVSSNGQDVVNAVAQGLPTTSKAAYAIWAYTSPTETRLIGGFNKTDNKGHLVYQGALPQDVTDVTRYKEILVTRETSGNPTKPGTIYLRGPIQAGSSGG
jgi:anti-sigma-K factor RskA